MNNNRPTIALFYLFGLLHSMSYTCSVLFGFTLDMQRGIYGLLLLLLYYKYIDNKAIYFNIAVLYLSIFTALFANDIPSHVMECLGFVLYYNVTLVFWRFLGQRYASMDTRLTHLYLFLAIPLLLYISPILFTPSNINLDFYSDPALELIGLKSRTVGWASACCIPMVLMWTRLEGPKKVFSYILLFTLIILVIGSGSRSSIIGTSLFVLTMIYRLNIKQKLFWTLMLVALSGFILTNLDHLSLSRRAELHKMGVSDDTFRFNLVSAFFSHYIDDFPKSLLPGGLGEVNMQYILNQFFDTKGFGTHNTYISIILGMGFFSVLLLKKIYTGIIKLSNQRFLINFIPYLAISITEDCFGPGQLLYFFFVGILVIQTK